jgi:flavin-dependent dehydrogenase
MSHEVIVVGGGPSGSTAAARLAQRGRRVLLLEKEPFPRFHIGESLLPCAMPLFDALGVGQTLADHGFLPKYAAEFVTADGSLSRRYAFRDGLIGGAPSAYEVDRSEFDKLLLDNSRRLGVEVRESAQVTKFELGRDAVSVTVREGADQRRFSAEMLIDASGQHSLVAGRLGLREMDRELKNFAVFSHFEGAERHSGDREGDISIVLVPGGWWWVIPLCNDRTSVGLVAPSRKLGGRKPDQAYFKEQIAATPYLERRLARARQVAPVRAISDYSYVSKRLAGDRWLLTGDAAAFIDPVFSTGVYLGMAGAFRAAEAVERALAERRFTRSRFVAYERAVLRDVGAYKRFVKGFYTPEFVEILMSPSDWLELRRAVTSLLAGFGAEQFSINWRIFVFRAIARANRSLGLAPRLPGRRDWEISL